LSNRRLLAIWLICALSYIPFLFSVQFTGEEAIYSLIPFEMSTSGRFLEPTIYGEAYRRPPLLNWLVIALAEVAGWDGTLTYLRLISSASSILSSALVFLLLRSQVGLTFNHALLGSVLYIICWQVLGGYGWKGYSDALFGFFVFSSLVFAWLAIERSSSVGWILLSVLACFFAFLTKAVTSYFFLLAFLFAYILLCSPAIRPRVFLVSISVVLSGLLVVGWYQLTPFGSMMASGATVDILDRFTTGSFIDFFTNAINFSGETYLNFFPISLILTFLWIKQRSFNSGTTWGNVAGLAALLNFLPYAFTSHTHSRYLMPLYGLVAIYCLALYLRHRAEITENIVWRPIVLVVLLKLLFSAGLFQWYTEMKRPNLEELSSQVITIADGRRIYSTDESWIGISVSDLINRSRVQQGFITKDFERSQDFLLLSRFPLASLGVPVLTYRDEFFVYCGGTGITGLTCPKSTVFFKGSLQ